jgi:hypothetical protein
MRCATFVLIILLAATSLSAADQVPDVFTFQVRIIEGNPQKKETHKVIGEATLATVIDRASRLHPAGEVQMPHVAGRPGDYVPHGVNILITPLALEGDAVQLDMQLLKINVVASDDKEFESETASRRWNKRVKLGKSNTFVLDKSAEKQTWLEITALVNRGVSND